LKNKKERIDLKMIDYEKVMSEIDKTKKRLTSAKERIPKIEEKIFKLTQKFTDLIVDDAPDKDIEKVRDEITKAEKELDLLQHLDVSTEFQKSLSEDSKIKALIDEFIKQQEAVLEKMVEEEKPYGEAVKESFEKVIEAIKKRRAFLDTMVAEANKIHDVKRAAGLSVPLMGELASYLTRITSFNFDNWLNRARIANGQLPKY
jgi:DNA repair exonuclease SbcCD ATPase subunit